MSYTPEQSSILNAAAAVFAEKGFDGARVDQIAAEAGVNKAMLYYRVGGKDELYKQVILRSQSSFLKALTGPIGTHESTGRDLEKVIQGIAERAAENPLIPSIILREIAGKGATLPMEGMDGIRQFMQIVRSTIRRGVEDGSIRAVNSVALQFLVIGAVFSLTLTSELRQMLVPADPGPLEPGEISSAILDILRRGILKEEDSI